MKNKLAVGLLILASPILILLFAYTYEYLWSKYGFIPMYVPTKCSIDDSGE